MFSLTIQNEENTRIAFECEPGLIPRPHQHKTTIALLRHGATGYYVINILVCLIQNRK